MSYDTNAHAHTHSSKGFTAPETEPATSRAQTWAALTTRVLTAILFILLLIWLVGQMGGLSWHPDENFFNLHAFFMIMGVGVFLTNGVVSWRDCPIRMRHVVVKYLHFFFNASALLFVALGLYVTFKANDGPHFVTFHSWMALFGLLMLGIQAVAGIMTYALPVTPLAFREKMLPKHAGLGLATYILLMFLLITGIVEWLALRRLNEFQSLGGAGSTYVDASGNANEGDNSLFTARPIRDSYRQAKDQVGNVVALLILLTTLAAMYALIPRRNLSVDRAEGGLRTQQHHHHPATSVTRGKAGSYSQNAEMAPVATVPPTMGTNPAAVV